MNTPIGSSARNEFPKYDNFIRSRTNLDYITESLLNNEFKNITEWYNEVIGYLNEVSKIVGKKHGFGLICLTLIQMVEDEVKTYLEIKNNQTKMTLEQILLIISDLAKKLPDNRGDLHKSSIIARPIPGAENCDPKNFQYPIFDQDAVIQVHSILSRIKKEEQLEPVAKILQLYERNNYNEEGPEGYLSFNVTKISNHTFSLIYQYVLKINEEEKLRK